MRRGRFVSRATRGIEYREEGFIIGNFQFSIVLRLEVGFAVISEAFDPILFGVASSVVSVQNLLREMKGNDILFIHAWE